MLSSVVLAAVTLIWAPNGLTWGEAPPGFPPGARMAVLYGDPAQPGMFVARFTLPAGTRLGPHTHPTDEVVTVLSGELAFGYGDDPSTTVVAPATVVIMPARRAHYLHAHSDVVFQVSAEGPFAASYLNAIDDPRK